MKEVCLGLVTAQGLPPCHRETFTCGKCDVVSRLKGSSAGGACIPGRVEWKKRGLGGGLSGQEGQEGPMGMEHTDGGPPHGSKKRT